MKVNLINSMEKHKIKVITEAFFQQNGKICYLNKGGVYVSLNPKEVQDNITMPFSDWCKYFKGITVYSHS